MKSKFIGLLNAAHFLPTMTVTTLTFILAVRTSNLTTALGIALTFFSGQLIVGWSNDLIDFSDDLAHQRSHKPLVSGTIMLSSLQLVIVLDSLLLLLLTIFGPLSGKYGLLHLLAIASALSYNLKLKRTLLSFLPYAISFGLLPLIILGATNYPYQWWAPAIGALFGIGVHIANVFKDLEEDLESGIRGLPQIAGERLSRFICTFCFGGSALILYFQTDSVAALIILIGAITFLFPLPRKITFPLAMVLGLATMLIFAIGLSSTNY